MPASTRVSRRQPREQWPALGLDLTLVPTAEGGRKTPVLLAEPLRYRPNWELPDMTGADQAGAPVLCSSAHFAPPVRMGCHQPTKDYAARTAEGKTKTEIMRWLKRYIAGEVFPLLIT